MSSENISFDETVSQPSQSQQQPQSQSPTRNKSKRPRKVIWTPSNEKETYSTVVVNYHYTNKMDQSTHHSTGASSKNRDHWHQVLATINAKRSSGEDSDSVPNLRKLYEETPRDTKQNEAAQTSAARLSKETFKQKSRDEFQKRLKEDFQRKSVPKKEDVTVELYCVPSKQKAVVEELYSRAATVMITNKPKQDDIEIIVISDDEDDFHDAGPVPETIEPVQEHTPVVKHDSSSRSTQNPDPQTSDHHSSAENSKKGEAQQLNSSLPTTSSKQKLKRKGSQNSFKQRQLELHRHRIAVEEKRLELLEVKLSRERGEMLREQILFEKELELKAAQLRHI